MGCGILMGVFCLLSMTLMFTIYQYGAQDHAQPADTIIVLGAGSRRVIVRRTEHALTLWQDGIAPTITCTGGDTPGRRQAEALYCRDRLLEEGVPTAAIFIETESRSTEENAMHVVPLMEANGWSRVVLVSDNYHLWRAKLIFEEQFDDKGWQVYTSPAQLTQTDLPTRIMGRVLVREVLATYWHVGKSLLGLPYTDFPPS